MWLICVWEYLSIQTCCCLCWLICRRERSRVRTKMSCSWQTSWPTRGNSMRRQSFTNTPAMNPKPCACTLICACLTTQRWLFCCLTTINTFHLCAQSATCFDAVERVFPRNVQFVPNWGPALCSTSPITSVFHLLLYHWDPNIYHLISAHTSLCNMTES